VLHLRKRRLLGVLEASIWLIEPRVNGDYRVVTQAAPANEFQKAAELILQTADSTLPKQDFAAC